MWREQSTDVARRAWLTIAHMCLLTSVITAQVVDQPTNTDCGHALQFDESMVFEYTNVPSEGYCCLWFSFRVCETGSVGITVSGRSGSMQWTARLRRQQRPLPDHSAEHADAAGHLLLFPSPEQLR
jgi:hypothetical protein